ncbi:NAD(P)H-dependent oxidoreductase [Saprospiraceae bacterium]|nr:NAD(P)H-dependent oxidoreductase [Saprospiraceae bacterium]
MKIIAFGASTSKTSINKDFAKFTAYKIQDNDVTILDLNDYELPVYSIDVEERIGIPDNAKRFYNNLRIGELIIISLAEHNGSYTSAFKNLFDWVSRHELKMFEGKKMILLSTAPGVRGGLSCMEAAIKSFPFHGADIIANFTLPKHGDNLKDQEDIKDEDLRSKFNQMIKDVKEKCGITS